MLLTIEEVGLSADTTDAEELKECCLFPEVLPLLEEFKAEFNFFPRREIVKCKGSFPSRRIISGKIRRRAFINQLHT